MKRECGQSARRSFENRSAVYADRTRLHVFDPRLRVCRARLSLARGDRRGAETILTLEQSLAAIDQAIAEARGALASDPNSGLLNRLLANHQQAKLRVLQRAAAAMQI